MESWLPAIFGFGGVLVGSLFSLWLTWLQLKNADKRFERELAKAREDFQRQRRWEIRGEPLLKLRAELARMATKLNLLVFLAQKQSNQSDTAQDLGNKDTQQAADEWLDYGTSGDFLQTLYLQYDTELLKLVDDIRNSYLVLLEYARDFNHLRADGRKEFRDLFQKIRTRIPEVQSVINQRLEEL